MQAQPDICRRDKTISEKLGAGREILKWILTKQHMMAWEGFIWLRTGATASSCEHGNEL
jgi:hypothetical protein